MANRRAEPGETPIACSARSVGFAVHALRGQIWSLFLVLALLVRGTTWAQPLPEPVGVEFQVNTYTTNGQYSPAVAADAEGDFVVVWRSYVQDGSSFGVFGQRYTSAGVALGGEFQVNTYTTNFQSSPAVAADAEGDFVVVWQSYVQGASVNCPRFGGRLMAWAISAAVDSSRS